MIKAPFNFVPLSDKVFFPDWADQISHDIPFEDGEDGMIDLKITNLTPLFTKNGINKTDKEEYSSHVLTANGLRKYFIPGTTLKGCFRSVMEILSYAKMQRYNNDSFGIPREFDTRKADNKYYMQFMKDVRCGWLQKEDDGNYYLSECVSGVVDITHKEIRNKFPNFNIGRDHTSAEIKQKSLCKDSLYPEYIKDEKRYQIVCTGYMNKKSKEYLFSLDQKKSILVNKDVVMAFESVHKNTDYYGGKNGKGGFLKNRLRKGDPIPVFFTSKKGEVTAMGITRMFRYPYPINVENAIANCYSEKVDYKKRDLPETIFGYIDEKKSLKGRVAFTSAFADNDIDDSSLIVMKGVLGQPASSYYPLYLKQDGSNYKTYKDLDVKIAGRKRYRITKDKSYLSFPIGNDNEKVYTTLRAIPAGQTFKGRIVFHNLRPVEIGALISSLTMNGTSGVFHNIGMGKSFGLGQIHCDIELKGLSKSANEYLRDFECELALAGFNIAQDPNLNKLIAIASPTHTKETMEYMDLKQYTVEKASFSTLKEPYAPQIHTVMSLEEIFSVKVKKQEEAERKRQEEERLEMERVQKEAEIKAAEVKAAQEREEEERKKRLELQKAAGLAVLNEKNEMGNYRWTKWDSKRILQTMKKLGLATVPLEQIPYLEEYIKRLELKKDKDKEEVKKFLINYTSCAEDVIKNTDL